MRVRQGGPGRGPGDRRGPGRDSRGPGRGRQDRSGSTGRTPDGRRAPKPGLEESGSAEERPARSQLATRGPDRPAERPYRGAPGKDTRQKPRSSAPNERAKRVREGQEPAPPPVGSRLAGIEEVIVRIEKLVAGGEGLARVDGVPLFVPRSAPGDFLKVRIVERHTDYGRAEIVKIFEGGPARREDPVPELSQSGICDLQHLDDRAQPLLKATAVKETLERLGKMTLPPKLELITGEPWGYRLRTQIHTDVDPVTGGVRVGYHARGTNDVIPVSRCPLLVPELEALLAELPLHLGPKSPRRLDLAAGDGGAVTVAPVVPGLPHGEVSTQVGEFAYHYDARAFFQSHRGLLPRLVEATVGPWEGETAVDLYAGVGLFSLPLSRRYGRVIAVESDTLGARFARINVRRNKVTNVEVVGRSVESWIAEMPPQVDRVVVDPPRGGLSWEALKTLVDRRPARITYVSCHPAALARDLRRLQKGYEPESVSFVDLFPQTGHMEVIVQLVRKEEG